MTDNVIKFVPPQREQQKEAIASVRKDKALTILWETLRETVGEGLLFSGLTVVALSLIYVLICFCAGESPFNNSELPYVGLGFLWGFFSVTLNDGLRGK